MKQGFLGLAAACALAFLALPMSAARADGYQGHVVIILDGSGSMNDPMDGRVIKMDAAKRALKEVLKQIAPGTQVGMLVFSSDASSEGWVYPLGALDANRLNAAIDQVQAGGGTPLGEYIKRGADALLETRKAAYGYGTYRLLVVTDGEATDMDDMVRYATEVPLRGITMDVIGVKMDQTPVLSQLAHSYRKADDPESLARALEDVFAEVAADQAGDAAAGDFELLQALPFEAAEAMLAGLAKTSDTPIGEPVQAALAVQDSAPPQQPAAPAPAVPADSGDGSSIPFPVAAAFILFFIVAVFRGVSKKNRR